MLFVKENTASSWALFYHHWWGLSASITRVTTKDLDILYSHSGTKLKAKTPIIYQSVHVVLSFFTF